MELMRKGAATAGVAISLLGASQSLAQERPNILLAISDDQSWLHTSAAGSEWISTPHFDRIAREGVYAQNCHASAPICTPARASLLSGREPWQLEEAMVLLSTFPRHYTVFPEILEQAGYHVGVTDKGWGPGQHWGTAGWPHNPAGPSYSAIKTTPPTTGMSEVDYAANFEAFLDDRAEGQPFCFWYGAKEPHVRYEAGSGLAVGIDPSNVVVPPFLPDTPQVRSDLADYALEIQYFDQHLGLMLQKLEEIGELDNTLIIVTGDNGMPFAHAKGTCYEYGTHVPLAVRWGSRIPPGKQMREVISFTDFAPTILEAAGLPIPPSMSGESFLSILTGEASRNDTWCVTGRERQNHARDDFLGYPIRALRTERWLYVHNFKPERWPAGKPDLYLDVDPLPYKDELIASQDDPAKASFVAWAFGKRPQEELYHIGNDPGCLNNLAADPAHAERLATLRAQLMQHLRDTHDPRAYGYGDIFDSYHWIANANPAFEGYSNVKNTNPALVASALEVLASDADGDELTLMTELFLGTDPSLPTKDPVTVTRKAPGLVEIAYSRDVRNQAFEENLQWSADMKQWHTLGNVETSATHGTREIRSVTIETAEEELFARIRTRLE